MDYKSTTLRSKIENLDQRGFHEESDIDFAVVLKNPTTTSTSEIMKVSDVGNDLSLKYGQLITYIGIPEFKLKQSNLGIYQ